MQSVIMVNDAMIAAEWKKRARSGSGRVLFCWYYRTVHLFRSVLLNERLEPLNESKSPQLVIRFNSQFFFKLKPPEVNIISDRQNGKTWIT